MEHYDAYLNGMVWPPFLCFNTWRNRYGHIGRMHHAGRRSNPDKKEKWATVEKLPKKEREVAAKELSANIKSILAMTYIQNLLIYTGIVLATAHVSRTYGWL